VKFSEIERIEIQMMVGYGDRQRSHQDVCHLFNNVQRREILLYNPQCLNWLKFRETENVKDIPRSGRPKSTTNQDQAFDVLLRVSGQTFDIFCVICPNYVSPQTMKTAY
jgi:hypothetical protein